MAVDTPVLERPTTNERLRECAVPSRIDFMAEEEHNARIRDTYKRLINPDNKIEDVFGRVQAEEPVAVQESVAPARPYYVENARADAAIFRADSAVNARREEAVAAQPDVAAFAPAEEENEDSLPTPTTIQYQTLGRAEEKKVSETTDKRTHLFGKREKIIVAVFVAVVVALLTLVIVNSAVIANLNADITHVQDSITTVRGALAGVNSSVEEIIHNSISH